MLSAMRYLERADERSRDRFMFHLTNKFFPDMKFTKDPHAGLTREELLKKICS